MYIHIHNRARKYIQLIADVQLHTCGLMIIYYINTHRLNN